ncbi:MAG: insulinase family protein, partial [Rhodospirillales bacterium]|nr:insulinase family protein [Rhodospirillales bacterium]
MPLQFQQRTLDNGLTIIAELNPEAHTAAVGFFVKTGARDEPGEQMGVSHFLEHMMFKGTARRTADDVNREFDEIGANYNAFTSHEQTVYYAHVLPEYMPRAVDIIGDMLRPALRSEDFEMEKNVILEEIGMYDDRPQWRLYETLGETYFGDHRLAHRVLGTLGTITSLTADQMRGYFEQRYSPDNIIVAATGRVDFDALVADVERLAGNWQPTGAQREFDPLKLTAHELTIDDPRVSRHYLGIFWPAPGAQDTRRYVAKIIADVLGDSEGSRLYWALVDPGLADEADATYAPQDNVGYNYAYTSCDPDRAEQVEAKLIETIQLLRDDLNEDEIERAKNKIAT